MASTTPWFCGELFAVEVLHLPPKPEWMMSDQKINDAMNGLGPRHPGLSPMIPLCVGSACPYCGAPGRRNLLVISMDNVDTPIPGWVCGTQELGGCPAISYRGALCLAREELLRS